MQGHDGKQRISGAGEDGDSNGGQDDVVDGAYTRRGDPVDPKFGRPVLGVESLVVDLHYDGLNPKSKGPKPCGTIQGIPVHPVCNPQEDATILKGFEAECFKTDQDGEAPSQDHRSCMGSPVAPDTIDDEGNDGKGDGGADGDDVEEHKTFDRLAPKNELAGVQTLDEHEIEETVPEQGGNQSDDGGDTESRQETSDKFCNRFHRITLPFFVWSGHRPYEADTLRTRKVLS